MWLKDPPDRASSLNASQTAVDLDPKNAAAHWRLASNLWNLGQQERAIGEYELAWELGQDDPLVLSGVAGLFMYTGDLERGIEIQRRAVAADPLNLVNVGNLTAYLTELGRVSEADVAAGKLVELAPASRMTLSSLGFIRLLQGRFDEALQFAEHLPDDEYDLGSPGLKLRLTAMVQYSLGNQAASDHATARFSENYAQSAPVDLAYIHAWRGETMQALYLLETQTEQNLDYLSVYILESRYLARLNGEPRWAAIKQTLRDRPIPDWWTNSSPYSEN
jgi:tetratricopeptide (TPR) repeat protein